MTTETIDKRIEELKSEQAELVASNERAKQQLQQIVLRFEQVRGGIDELTKLKLNGAA